MNGPLYSTDMDGTRAEARDGRIDELHAEAKAAVGYAADTVRQVADRYRLVQHEERVRLQAVTDNLRAGERRPSRGGDQPSEPPPLLPAVTDKLSLAQNLPLLEAGLLGEVAARREATASRQLAALEQSAQHRRLWRELLHRLGGHPLGRRR